MTTEPTIHRLTKTEWIAALRRSPKAKGVLCQARLDDEGNPTGVDEMCCLGVLASEEGMLNQDSCGDTLLWMSVVNDEVEVDEWSTEHEEMYKDHPNLDVEIQNILIGCNDITDSFEDLVIPAIEALLNEDLTTQERHLLKGRPAATAQSLGLLGADPAHERQRLCCHVVAQLVEGKTLAEVTTAG